jgi:hypothetical protein
VSSAVLLLHSPHCTFPLVGCFLFGGGRPRPHPAAELCFPNPFPLERDSVKHGFAVWCGLVLSPKMIILGAGQMLFQPHLFPWPMQFSAFNPPGTQQAQSRPPAFLVEWQAQAKWYSLAVCQVSGQAAQRVPVCVAEGTPLHRAATAKTLP